MYRNGKWITAALAAALVIGGGALVAQQEEEAGTQRQASQQRQGGQGQSAELKVDGDQLMAACLAIGNQKEIAISAIGRDRAESEEVRQFAETMISEHTEALSKLKALAPAAATEPLEIGAQPAARGERQPNRRETNRENDDAEQQQDPTEPQRGEQQPQTPRRQAQDRAGQQDQQGGKMVDIVQLDRELAEKCIQSAAKAMGEKKGAEFDSCFMYAQVMAHQHMIDTLEVYQQHATGELKQYVTEAHEMCQKHLEHAKSLAKQSEQEYIRTASREGATERSE